MFSNRIDDPNDVVAFFEYSKEENGHFFRVSMVDRWGAIEAFEVLNLLVLIGSSVKKFDDTPADGAILGGHDMNEWRCAAKIRWLSLME